MLTIEPLNIEGLDVQGNQAVLDRLTSVLSGWEGTRYLAGCQAKGVGVDCVRFVSGVLDELQGSDTKLERLPQDSSFHAKDKCFAALRTFLTGYEHEVVEGPLQPGDVIVAGPRGGGPGHALITGTNCLWHCDSKSVTRTGLTFPLAGSYYFKKSFRLMNRERWIEWPS